MTHSFPPRRYSDLGRVLAVTEIALDYRRAAHLEAALEPALFWQRAPIAIGEEQVDSHRRPARKRGITLRIGGRGRRAERRQFGHAPTRLHGHAELQIGKAHV